MKHALSEEEPQSTMQDWIAVGLKMGHRLAVINGIDLNRTPKRAAMASMVEEASCTSVTAIGI